MMTRIASLYKDNDESVYAYVIYNANSIIYETHFYDGSIKEEPPVGLFLQKEDAIAAAEEWVK